MDREKNMRNTKLAEPESWLKQMDDIAKIEGSNFGQWMLNNPEKLLEIAKDKDKRDSEEYKKAAEFLIAWVAKRCSPEWVKRTAGEIGYNDKPLFFAKKKRVKLVSEIAIINTAIVIFVTNMVVNPDRAPIIIDAYLETAKNTMFDRLEEIDSHFSDRYKKRIGAYFLLLKDNNIDEMGDLFLSALGVKASGGGPFITLEIHKSIKEMYEALKDIFTYF